MNILFRWQRKIFILCWCAYASAYLCRTNLSIALPVMMKTFEWSKTSAGWIGSAFFWAYAIGQLINGYIGDKVKARVFIFTGLCISSVMNLFVGFSHNLLLIILFWTINGFFLSTLWGPIVKTLSLWFSHERRTDVAVGISTSMIGGYFFAWGLVGWIIARRSWQWAFWIPAITVILFAFVWIWKMRNCPEEVGLYSPNYQVNKAGAGVNGEIKYQNAKLSLNKIIVESRLWLVALACVAQGVIKDGITLWGPTFLQNMYGLSQKTISVFSLAIPFMSLFGIFGAGWLNKKLYFREKISIMLLLGGAALSSILLYRFVHVSLCASTLFLSLASAFTYGANTLLLTVIPLGFSRYNRVSTIAGFLDFCSYMGAALAGILTGIIVDCSGWRNIIILWAVLALVGVIGIFTASDMEEGGHKNNLPHF